MQEPSQFQAQIRGRVQGVFFRDFTRIHARRLGVTGWVQNLPDGYTVEVLAQGTAPSLERLLEVLRRGPPEARVEKVEVEWEEPTQVYDSFRVL